MIIIDSRENEIADNRIIIIVGLGLIGTSLANLLLKKIKATANYVKIDWENADKFEQIIEKAICNLNIKKVQQIDWVWSAGKAGFNATPEDVKNEYNLYAIFLKKVDYHRANTFPNLANNFHLISSAGGLFEGQTLVNTKSTPKPKRPYGELKLKQEKLAIELFSNNYSIYRLSSVYGNGKQNQRIGLISTLIRNTYSCKLTNIQGYFDTKRDYVWLDDVTDYISNRILSNELKKTPVYFLISGKPSTIFEIIDIVKKISNQKVLYKLDLMKTNADQIVFSSRLFPPQWHPTALQLCIHNVYHQLLKQ